jgi:hypothetical protein
MMKAFRILNAISANSAGRFAGSARVAKFGLRRSLRATARGDNRRVVLRRLYVSEPLVLKPDRAQARLRSLSGTITIAARRGVAKHFL